MNRSLSHLGTVFKVTLFVSIFTILGFSGFRSEASSEDCLNAKKPILRSNGDQQLCFLPYRYKGRIYYKAYVVKGAPVAGLRKFIYNSKNFERFMVRSSKWKPIDSLSAVERKVATLNTPAHISSHPGPPFHNSVEQKFNSPGSGLENFSQAGKKALTSGATIPGSPSAAGGGVLFKILNPESGNAGEIASPTGTPPSAIVNPTPVALVQPIGVTTPEVDIKLPVRKPQPPVFQGPDSSATGLVSAEDTPEDDVHVKDDVAGTVVDEIPARWGRKHYTEAAAQALDSVGTDLLRSTPKDISDWCPNYKNLGTQDRKKFWVYLISSLAQFESDFQPAREYKEPSSLKGACPQHSHGRVVSTGLLQLSGKSATAYFDEGCESRQGTPITCANRTQLQDPKVNLKCGVAIMNKWVAKDGVIQGKSGSKSLGAARYWSPFRSEKKRNKMKAWASKVGVCDKKYGSGPGLKSTVRGMAGFNKAIQ